MCGAAKEVGTKRSDHDETLDLPAFTLGEIEAALAAPWTRLDYAYTNSNGIL